MVKTTSIHYMGSKQKFATEIQNELDICLQDTKQPHITLLDTFTGSTRVAQMFRQWGYKTLTSDYLPAAEAYASTFIETPTPNRSHLQELIDELNSLPGEDDWITRNYCEVEPAERKDPTKMVNAFLRENGRKADAIRNQIAKWAPKLQHWEHMTLLCSLLLALDKVQNSQGHSRAFFRTFDVPASRKPIELKLPPLVGDSALDLDVMTDKQFQQRYPLGAHYSGDVLSPEYAKFVRRHLDKKGTAVAYFDPPYTASAKYNLFYHLWDSVFLWDKPTVGGATNRRIDRMVRDGAPPALESPWCNKATARSSFIKLFNHLDMVDYFIVSYSNESIINHASMLEIFEESGLVLLHETHEKKYRRHALAKSGRASEKTKQTASMENTEYVFTLKRI